MECNCHCNGKCKMLGVLEQRIINVLWDAERELKPAEVLLGLNQKYSYTTIMTVLKRMADKGILNRQLKQNTYYYSTVKDKDVFVAECLSDLFERLVHSYGKETVKKQFSEFIKQNCCHSQA